MISWLPPLFKVSPWTEDMYEQLYSIFCNDIRDHKLLYKNNIVCIGNKIEDGKEEIFWHLTDKLEKEKPIPRRKRKFQKQQNYKKPVGRLPDFRRCERLPWIKPVIENSQEPVLLAWDYLEGDKKIKTYVWFKDEKYVVIMKKLKKGVRRLITAFYIDGSKEAKKFEEKYNKRIKY